MLARRGKIGDNWRSLATFGRTMSNDRVFTADDFPTQVALEERWPATLSELVDGWFAWAATLEEDDNRPDWVFASEHELVRRNPDMAIEFIDQVILRGLTDEQRALFAAGPLENLLAWHGPQVIDRVEAKARKDPAFRSLLGGVWQNAMPDDIWVRVQAVAGPDW